MKKKLITFCALIFCLVGLLSGCLGEKVKIYEGITLQVGETYDFFEEDNVYYSTDESVATVSNDGLVTAVGSGECKIISKTSEKRREIPITVIEKTIPQTAYFTLYTDGGVINDEKWIYCGNSKYYVLEESEFPTPVKEGYTFDGWYNGEEFATNSNGGEATAKWSIIEFFVTYELNGGVNNDLNPQKFNYFQSEDIVLYDATYSGKMFVGWYLDAEFTTKVTKIVPNKRNVTLYARFSEYFTVEYKLNSPDQDGSVSVPIGQKLQRPSVYCEDGYFVEWFTDAKYTTSYNFYDTVENDFTIYGKKYVELRESFFAFDNYTPPQKITSLEQFKAYLDYVNFYEIDENKYVDVDFEEYDIAEANNDFSDLLMSTAMPSFVISYSKKTVSGKKMIAVKVAKGQPELKTYTPTSKPSQFNAIEFGQLNSFNSCRTSAFDDFKYKNFIKEVSVSTTNQLFFALEHRAKPIPLKNSAAEIALSKCKDILRKICDDTLSDLQKAKAIYTYLVQNVEYVLPPDTADVYEALSYDAYYVEGVLNNGAAVCDGISKTFSVLMNLEGIRCIRTTSSDHAWNEAFINGKWYTFDATHGNLSTSENIELLAYHNFMINETVKEGYGYTDSLRTEIIADGIYDFYANEHFIYNDVVYDYNVNDLLELTALFAYSYAKATEYSYTMFSINLVFDYNYGAEYSDDIARARNNAGLRNVNISYYALKNTTKTNIIVLFK